MHPKMYREFERICSAQSAGGKVLEIGAVPSDKSLLHMDCLQGAREKNGINLDGPYEYRDIRIVKGNANDMSCFADATFDTILCNATLEHDKYFWKSIAEIKRIAKSGCLIVIAVPGYTKLAFEKFFLFKLLRKFRPLKFLTNSSLTFHVHRSPGDYYRFSHQALEEVFFDGMLDVNVYTLMIPPRVIGYGRKL